ncbi:MAG: hypothetical protein ABIJ75_07785 [Actinomycetota bacterium]
MHLSRLLVLIGVPAAAASLALPFATLPGAGRIAGIEGAAWPVMLLLGPVLLLFVLGDRVEAPVRPIAWLGLALAVAALGFAVVKAIDAWKAAGDTAGAVGPGAWVLPAAAAVVVAGASLGFSRRM